MKPTCQNDPTSSDWRERVDCGLPQGSSLGPLKFIVYAAEMQEVVTSRGVSFHKFADDSQLSEHILVIEIHAGKSTMIDCIADVELWCRSTVLSSTLTSQTLSGLSPDNWPR